MKGRVPVHELRQHVLDLCEKYEIRIEWSRNREAWAVRAFDLIRIPPIKSAISYAVALHEIGHVRGRYQGSKSQAIRERWAWVWAKRNALMWTPAMERLLRLSGLKEKLEPLVEVLEQANIQQDTDAVLLVVAQIRRALDDFGVRAKPVIEPGDPKPAA